MRLREPPVGEHIPFPDIIQWFLEFPEQIQQILIRIKLSTYMTREEFEAPRDRVKTNG